jgi:hypothetical protein
MLASALILGSVAIVAVFLALSRPVSADGAARQAAGRALATAVVVQAIHFTEEAATGFEERFPALFGLSPIPFPVFVAFNVAWLLIWIASIAGIRSGRADAFFAAWFLAIAGLLNAVAHPLLAVASAGYFPGLITSPFIGLACVLLWMRLRRATGGTMLHPPGGLTHGGERS